MRITVTLFVILLTSSVFSSFVQEIKEDYLQTIEKSNKIWLVYGSQDSSDPKKRILHDVSIVLSGIFKVGLLNSGNGNLKLYTDDGAVEEYSGKFEVDEIVKFTLENIDNVLKARSKVADDIKAFNDFKEKQKIRIEKQWEDEKNLRLKSNTIVVTPENWDSKFLQQRGPVLMNIYESNCSACIELNQIWESISTQMKGKAVVVKINITDSHQLEEHFKLDSYPSVRFYSAGVKNVNQFTNFQGLMKKFALREWMNGCFEEKKSGSIPELNKKNYESLCKTTKATCVILFTENPAQVEAKAGELAAKYSDKPITFLMAKKGSQSGFEGQAEVTSFPETIMMYCKQKKMFRMGGMDFQSIDDTINEITLGNRNGFVKYKFAQNLQ